MKFKVSHIDLSACSMHPNRHMYTIYFVLESLITHLTWLQHYCIIYGSLVKFEGVITTDNSSMFFRSFIFRC